MSSEPDRPAPPSRKRVLARLAAVVLPLAVGVVGAVSLAGLREPPAREEGGEEARTVSVLTVPALEVAPRAVGYGVAEPGDVWRAVAEVDGRVVERHPQLEVGAILPAGTLLLAIDPEDFELRLRELEAALRGARARLDALATRERTTGRSLEIERRSLAVARKELERRRRLVAENALSDSELDAQERAVLQQERAVQSLENELAAIPDERAQVRAELERTEAQRERARRDLEHTRITLPFDARIAAVEVETAQYVTPGQVLVQADGIAVTEVPAQLSVERFRALLDSAVAIPAFDPRVVGEYIREQGLTAQVRLHTADTTLTWPARVDRLSASLDPRTRTVGVVAAVDDPYANARPPERPPLVKNMYVEVRLRGRPRPDTLVIPRTALHGRQVYRVGEDDRLEIVAVTPGFTVGAFVTVAEGLAAGDRVLTGDLVPAIEGTLLDPVEDDALAARLRAAVAGDAAP